MHVGLIDRAVRESVSRIVNTPALFMPVSGNLALSAKASLLEADGRWSAGALLIWQDEEYWAKVCLERNHRGTPSSITVLKIGWSDDGVHWPVSGLQSHLRIMRTGESIVMHSSPDGSSWEFVRVFRFTKFSADLKAGFLLQTPWGQPCEAQFENIHLTERVPDDVRDGT